MPARQRHHLARIMKRAHRAARRMRAHFATYRASLAYALRCVYRSARALAYLACHQGRALIARALLPHLVAHRHGRCRALARLRARNRPRRDRRQTL